MINKLSHEQEIAIKLMTENNKKLKVLPEKYFDVDFLVTFLKNNIDAYQYLPHTLLNDKVKMKTINKELLKENIEVIKYLKNINFTPSLINQALTKDGIFLRYIPKYTNEIGKKELDIAINSNPYSIQYTHNRKDGSLYFQISINDITELIEKAAYKEAEILNYVYKPYVSQYLPDLVKKNQTKQSGVLKNI